MVNSSRKKRTPRIADIPNQSGILDIPEHAFVEILRRCSVATILKISTVCKEFHARCTSEELWRTLFQDKWGKLIDPATFSRRRSERSSPYPTRHWMQLRSRRKLPPGGKRFFRLARRVFPSDSFMGLYVALENGNVEFRAQVYNRDYTNPGFLLSCYDAKVSYDRSTDTFVAKYPARPPGEEVGISWSRLRPPPFSRNPGDLCLADSLQLLKPGDHVEVQWRHSALHRFGWWYARIGHSRHCPRFFQGYPVEERVENPHCRCHLEDTVRIEFNQYSEESKWHEAVLVRMNHREAEVEDKGFYGGVRKLHSYEEIFAWRQQWDWGKRYLD